MKPHALVCRFFCIGGKPARVQERPTIASGADALSE